MFSLRVGRLAGLQGELTLGSFTPATLLHPSVLLGVGYARSGWEVMGRCGVRSALAEPSLRAAYRHTEQALLVDFRCDLSAVMPLSGRVSLGLGGTLQTAEDGPTGAARLSVIVALER